MNFQQMLCNILVQILQYFEKKKKNNAHEKFKKTQSKVLQLRSTQFFFGTAISCPKRPKQKNSCSKIWLIDQLYIKLGFFTSRRVENVQLIPAHLQNETCKAIKTGIILLLIMDIKKSILCIFSKTYKFCCIEGVLYWCK